MEPKNQENAVLSQKRYAIARCIKYVQLLLIVLIFFLPTLQFTDKSKELKMEVSSSFSVFQYLIGDTATEIQIKGNGNKNSENSLLGALLQNVSVDVPRELFANDEELFFGFRIGPVLVGLIVGFVCAFASGSLNNTTNAFTTTKALIRQIQSAQNSKSTPIQTHLNNQMYITRVYHTFPKLFEFLEKFLFGTILTTYFLFCTIVIAQKTGAISSINFDWNFHIVYPIILTILMIFFINGGITSVVCSKDFQAIRSEGIRFDNDWEHPTIASDIKAIASLFQSKQALPSLSEDAKIEILQKYKSLLDAGIISEQEYEAKKAELLNQTKDKR